MSLLHNVLTFGSTWPRPIAIKVPKATNTVFDTRDWLRHFNPQSQLSDEPYEQVGDVLYNNGIFTKIYTQPPFMPKYIDDDILMVQLGGAFITPGSYDGSNFIPPRAGVGIYFGFGNPLNVAQPIDNTVEIIPGGIHNQFHADIQAAVCALDVIANAWWIKNQMKNINRVVFGTSSSELIHAIAYGITEWRKNKWVDQQGNKIQNWEQLNELDISIRNSKLEVQFWLAEGWNSEGPGLALNALGLGEEMQSVPDPRPTRNYETVLSWDD
ncbi:hypothetical protein BZA77DRAFT_295450 [Pyronema omphalodes]|nr:hypothetical protein BZA77DRAFT_295450 [Pyronema omphalodes]